MTKASIDELTAALDLTAQQQAKVRAWVEAGNLGGAARPDPAKLARFLDSILEGSQKLVFGQLIQSGKSFAQFAADRASATQPVDPKADAKARELVARLSNSDVEWDGDLIGLRPEIVGQPAKDILALGRPALAGLLTALKDEGKFAAAHVLLTKIVEPGFFYDATSEWNGLRVTLTADNRTVFYPQQIPSLIKQWRPAADGSLLTDRLAEHRMMVSVSVGSRPRNWENSGRRGTVEPVHWEPGDGVEFVWQRKGFRPGDWKQPVDGKIRGGDVHLWIMEPGYAPKQDKYADITPYPAAFGPAEEIAAWRGRRVFFWGGGDDWPTARADILAALKATDAPAAETQPATPSTDSGQAQPADIPARAIEAIERLQRRCKDDKALQGLAEEKIEDGRLTAETDGWWDDLPSKVAPFHNSGHGQLSIQLTNAEFSRNLMPWAPPPGCYLGRTVLALGETDRIVVVSTESSDPAVHRRLSAILMEELRAVGIDAKTGDDRMDSFGTPATSGPAPQTTTASAPAVPAPSLETLMALLGQPLDSEAVKSFQQKHELKMRGDIYRGCLADNDEAFMFIVKAMPGGQRGRLEELVLSIRRPPNSRFGNYAGGLPFGLSKEDTPEQVMKKFGRPTSFRLNSRQSGGLCFAKGAPNRTLLVHFHDGRIEEVTVEIPDEPVGSPAGMGL